jgi:dipeptidyl aminopeptidase/acylaminoacyl peptidase
VADADRAAPELWIADAVTRECRPLLPGRGLNTLFENYSWLDDDTIVVCVIPSGREEAPTRPPTPRGPRVQSNGGGNVAQARTYADLLKDSHDADLFEHFGASEFVTVNVKTGEVAPLAPAAAGTAEMHTRCDPSPDGQFIIMEALERPFSYAVPCGRFPKRVWVVNRAGETVRDVCSLPLADAIPIVNNSCRAGPRGVAWRPDRPAELYWTEAQDGGDPRVAAEPRDIVFTADLHAGALEGGSAAAGVPTFHTNLRFGGVSWGADGLGLLYESWYKTRTIKAYVVDTFGRADRLPRLLYDRNYEDSYDDPGSPLSRRMSDGTYRLAQVTGPLPKDGWVPAKAARGAPVVAGEEGNEAEKRETPGPVEWETGVTLILEGDGASDTGDRPFVDLLNLDTGATRRLWQCPGLGALERPGSIISDAGGAPITLDTLKILLSRETPSENPQYYSLELSGGGGELTPRRISDFPHPHPSLVDPPKEIIRYKRADGVDLNATLYLPPGYDLARDGPLPTLVWAYPREFNSAEAAGQLRDSPNRFTSISPMSPLVWLSRGYAVLEGPALPIIGNAAAGVEPNDSYVEQLVAGARAAVAAVVAKGVTDPRRVAVGGASYGAFMAANLLAHAPDLFACAVARSGAYNRTLTPFGFQSEERTLWQAPETYMSMSPFQHADRIKKPILLIHGEEDTNTGTNVIQSERFFAALKGNGAEAKLVLLPHESHSTRGFESVMHTLAETSDFLDEHMSLEAAERTEKAAAAAAAEAEVGAAVVAGGDLVSKL